MFLDLGGKKISMTHGIQRQKRVPSIGENAIREKCLLHQILLV